MIEFAIFEIILLNLERIKMKIKKIKIENYRSVKEISIDFEDNLNVFVGINGSGKTTILDAASTLLSWLVNRIQRQNASGNYISETDIRNETPFSTIEMTMAEKGNDFNWKILKIAKGVNSSEKSKLNEVSELASLYQKIINS